MMHTEQARLLMDALEVLHARSYGLLKLYSYVKEGIGAWRYWVFASRGEFPDAIQEWPGPKLHGSFPGPCNLSGTTPAEVADSLLARYPELAQAGRGREDSYTAWYQAQLAAHPGSILIMESSLVAQMLGRGNLPVPPLRAWHPSGPPAKQGSAMTAAREAASQRSTMRAIARARRRLSKR